MSKTILDMERKIRDTQEANWRLVSDRLPQGIEQPDTLRLSPNSFAVKSSTLFASGNWSVFYHDWPRQIETLRAHLQRLSHSPLRVWQEVRRLRQRGWLDLGAVHNDSHRRTDFHPVIVILACRALDIPVTGRLGVDRDKAWRQKLYHQCQTWKS